MGPDLQIVENTSRHLRVVSPQMFFWWGTVCMLAFNAAVTAFAVKTLPSRSAYLGKYLILSVPAVTIVFFFALGCTNVLDIDWDAGQVTAINRYLLGFSTSQALRTAEIDRAYIDFDRMGPRIAFHLNKGGDVLPLGKISMYKPSQYSVMEMINRGLQGRTPVAPSDGEAATGSQGFHMETSVDKAVRQEREFEEKLKKQQQENH